MEKTIKVKIEPHFAGGYRLEYFGKYITLFGRDRNYVQFSFFPVEEKTDDMFEEMVLVAVVTEIRNAKPRISKIDEEFIYIDLRAGEQYEW